MSSIQNNLSNHSRLFLRALTLVSLAFFLNASSALAGGKTVIGTELNYVAEVQNNSPRNLNGAFGVDPYIGREHKILKLVYLRPELKGSFAFQKNYTAKRMTGGLTIGLPLFISPSASIHGGYGWFTNENAIRQSGNTWDVGGALETRVAFVGLGVHFNYVFTPTGVPAWAQAGGQLSLRF